jgi:Second Messenger Oligonucleotide or Dinucleotide Synthetase domain
MAYSVQSAFDQFYGAINLAGDHRATANTRKDTLVALLAKHFDIVESFGSGSIPRFTALRAKADLDVIVALHFTKHIKDRTPAQVLQSVRDALGNYRNQVRKNGQAVTLYYDINNGTWIESNPKTHAGDIDSRASKCGPNFRKVIKFLKSWNKGHGSYLQSYHIEVMALEAFDAELNDLPWDMLHFFKRSRELAASSLWHGRGFADSYLTSSDREEAKKRLLNAEEKARMGWYYGKEGNIPEAIKYWKQVFGDSFPAYG